jgi:hypothetical protein
VPLLSAGHAQVCPKQDRSEGPGRRVRAPARLNSRQVPSTPFNGCVPRSSRTVLDPTTRSRTVPEVRISPGPAAPITRAAMCTAEREPPHDRRLIGHSEPLLGKLLARRDGDDHATADGALRELLLPERLQRGRLDERDPALLALNRRKVTDVQHLTAQPRRSAQRVF